MSTDASSATSVSGGSTASVSVSSVRAIARKDFQDAVRSWLFWGLSLFFFLLLVAVTGLLSFFEEDIAAQGATTAALVSLVSNVTRLIIPLIALILGWKAIAGERESGSIKILLSLPHSRKDVILGKLLGRSAVLSVSLVAGFTLAAVVVAAMLGSFDVADYIGLLAMSILYGIAYVSIAVSLSSLTKSTTIAGAAIFGVFVLFYVVWNAISMVVYLLMERGTISGVEVQGGFERPPDWAIFLEMIDPGTAYANVLSLATSVAEVDEETLAAQAELFGGELPFYLHDWFAFLVLAFWVVAPITVALYRFDRVDL